MKRHRDYPSSSNWIAEKSKPSSWRGSTPRTERVIIDERLGRRIAEYLGLNVTGTLGVLAKAKSAGLIPSFHEAAQAMRQQGIHYNAGLISRVALHLGEDPGSN